MESVLSKVTAIMRNASLEGLNTDARLTNTVTELFSTIAKLPNSVTELINDLKEITRTAIDQESLKCTVTPFYPIT
jgi:hypothetical protein